MTDASWPAIVLSLVSGLVGVVIGSVITLKADEQKERRLNMGAARVTFFELSENTAYLSASIKARRSTPLTVSTWTETRSRIASMLAPADLAVVATAYMKIAATKSAWELRGLGTAVASPAATQDAFDRADAAATILELAGWPDQAERDALHDQLKGHVTPSI